MNKLLTAAVIALLGGCLGAQTHEGELQKPKTTTWKGTLVDSGCRSPYSEGHKTTNDSSSYPAVTSTSPYGLITADGKCIPLDVDSTEKVSGMLKIKTDWSENIVKFKPRKVEVAGTEHGGQISVDEIQIGGPAGPPSLGQQ